MGSFDIRDALTGRNYVTAQVPFWLEDKVFYDLEEVKAVHNKLKQDDPAFAATEERMAALEKEREDSAYVLHLRAISNRVNEDIISKALAKYPIKRDAYGREEEEQAMERGKYIRELQLAAHMTKIVNPDGVAQVVDDDNRQDISRAILNEAPPISVNVIDQAIAELNKKFEVQTRTQQDTDFLSVH